MIRYLVLWSFFANLAVAMNVVTDSYYIVVKTTDFGRSFKENFAVEEVKAQVCDDVEEAFSSQVDDLLRPYYSSVFDGCKIGQDAQDLNEMSCAEVKEFTVSYDGSTYSELILDITNCEYVNNSSFRMASYFAARQNLANDQVPYPKVRLKSR